MGKFILLLIAIISFNFSIAEKLILINYQNDKELKVIVANKELRINYYSDNIIIATVDDSFDG